MKSFKLSTPLLVLGAASASILSLPAISQSTQNVKTIPVVVHKVYRGSTDSSFVPEERISDEQVIEAIKQVNEDYNGRNARRENNIHKNFLNLEANVGVRFELAKYGPDGYPTSGITELDSSFTKNGEQEALKETLQWPQDQYLNIWVVKSSDGASGSGYAHRPVNVFYRPTHDGVVVSHWAVGRTGTARESHFGTLTHEIGHWADLDHTWSEVKSNGEDEACNYDDGVADTPNTIGQTDNTLCGTFVSTCGSQDNVSNFMNYACAVMFTRGQKERMHTALESSLAGRNKLHTQANKINTGLIDTSVRALFKGDQAHIKPGESVLYTDESIVKQGGRITQWHWRFPGGSPSSHNGRTPPAVTYDTAGVYEVSLTVTNDRGRNTRVRPEQIEVGHIVLMPKSTNGQAVSASKTISQETWFYDDGFKGNFSNNQNATLTLRPDSSGEAIEVEFEEFNFMDVDEKDKSCQFDYLAVYDGDSTSAPLIGKFCGKYIKPTIRSTHTSGALTFKMISDDNTFTPGFKAKVSSIDKNTVASKDILVNLLETKTVSTCDATLWDPGKTLNYPNGSKPGDSPDTDAGIVTIKAVRPASEVIARFEAFEMESGDCKWDYLEVFNGDSTSAPLLGRFCGTDLPNDLKGVNGALTFRFASDDNTSMAGFKVDISCDIDLTDDVSSEVESPDSTVAVPDACATQRPISTGTLKANKPVCLADRRTIWLNVTDVNDHRSFTLTTAHGRGDLSVEYSNQTWPNGRNVEAESSSPGSNSECIYVEGGKNYWGYFKLTGSEGGTTAVIDFDTDGCEQ